MGTNSKWQKQNPVRELAHGVCRETGTPTCRKTALLKAKAGRKWRTYPSLKVCRKTSTELIYHMLPPPCLPGLLLLSPLIKLPYRIGGLSLGVSGCAYARICFEAFERRKLSQKAANIRTEASST
jgi:hypothetical protein